MIDLTAAGLTETEAKCYAALLDKPDWKPAELAKYVSETRTNTYKILDNLTSLGLAERFDKDKKLHYRAANPARLLDMARAKRAAMDQAEKELELSTSSLMENYYKIHEQPGVRYFQGEDGLREIFTEVSRSKDEVLFINTAASIDFYGFDTLHNLRMLAIDAGVKRRGLTPDIPEAPKDHAEIDARSHLDRTWLQKDDYTAPVEWGVFEDKLYIISYGNEALGMIIQSRQIADSFKQIYRLLDRGQKLLPDYGKLPVHARHIGAGQTKPAARPSS